MQFITPAVGILVILVILVLLYVEHYVPLIISESKILVDDKYRSKLQMGVLFVELKKAPEVILMLAPYVNLMTFLNSAFADVVL